MNREKARELLPIFEAFANSEAIQFRLNNGLEHKWLDLPDNEDLCVTFPADDYEYRVKPKPREFWVRLRKSNDEIMSIGINKICEDETFNVIKVHEVE